MTVIKWNPLVNNKFNLEGEYSIQGNYVKTLEFQSGKKRNFLTNSFVPRVFPSLSLFLDNENLTESGKTEFEEFEEWFNVSLRYGILPFIVTRIGYKRKEYIKIDELGIYSFIPESLQYDTLDGIVLAAFGLEEESIIPEVEYIFLAANDGEILLSRPGQGIVI